MQCFGIVCKQVFDLSSKKPRPKGVLDISADPQFFVYSTNRPLAIELFKILQEVGSVLIPGIPIRFDLLLPVRRCKIGVETHPVCDALDETAWGGAEAIVLETVDELVGYDAVDFGGHARGGVDLRNVRERKVNLLDVVVVIVADCVGHAGHVLEDERHGAGWRDCRLRVWGSVVQEFEDVQSAGG